MTEKQVREIIKNVLRSELSTLPTKDYVKKTIKDELEKSLKNSLEKDDIRDIIKDVMIKYHKWMWDKKGIWINQI
jgi:ribosomal protein S3AE